MVTLTKYGAKYNRLVLNIEGLSTDTPKPTVFFYEYDYNGALIAKTPIQNGSIYTEIDTGDTYMYDADNTTWHKVSIGGGGGGGTQGGIILVGETTTQLVDNATTNPITVDGQSYTAQPNDAVIYGNKEFLFDGTKWHEFGDLSGLASKDIGAMTNYVKAQTGAAIATTDTLNEAIGKVEKRVDVNETNISSCQAFTNNATIDSDRKLYISATKPTGDIPLNSTWIDGKTIKTYGRTANMFNKNASDIDDTGYIRSNGEKTTSVNFITSGYIPVSGLTNVTISGYGTASEPAYCLYNSGKEYISGAAYTGQTTITITIGNAEYLRFSVKKTDIDTAMANEGSSAQPHVSYLDWT